jgi:hypothetical protein
MTNWWSELGILKQIFYTVAVPATLILFIQSALAIIGLGDFDGDVSGGNGLGGEGLGDSEGFDSSSMDSDQSFDGDFRFFTIRGIVAFFSVFGWTGAVLANGLHPAISIVFAFLAGSLAMVGIGYLFYAMTRLQSSGNIRYENCIGKSGEVYLTIPPNKQGKGKVTLTVQERLIEVSAITVTNQPIKSGEQVKVTEMLPDHTAVVERI